LESIDALEEYVEKSQSILIFASKGYFTSINCLREVGTAVDKAKPLVIVFDPVRGGATLEDIKEKECPIELQQGIFKDHTVVIWQRIKDFQLVSLKLIASELLFACPGYKEEYFCAFEHMDATSPSTEKKTLYEDIFVPGEVTETPLKFHGPVRLYVSANNPGAREVGEVLQKAMEGLELSADAPPAATHFLLYLAHETFVGEAGERLAAEVRAMMFGTASRSIVMLHENDLANGGCEFSRFFSTTPQDLITGGLYKALALAYYPGLFRPVSLTLIAKKLGAVGGVRSLWLHQLQASNRSKGGSVAIAQVAVSGRDSVRNSSSRHSQSGQSKASPPVNPSTSSTSALADEHIEVEIQSVEEFASKENARLAACASSPVHTTGGTAVESRAQEADEHKARASGVSGEDFDAASRRLEDAEAQPRRPSLSLGQAVSSGGTFKNLLSQPEDSKGS
jgi:hypothetical protein